MENIMLDQALSFAVAQQKNQLEELKELLSIPSISAQPQHKGDIARAAQWLADHLLAIGMQRAKVMPTSGHPVVYAEWMGAGKNKPTVLIYGHYDVQPPEPFELWHSEPFKPEVRGQNLYARGVSDDKGQIFLHVKAVEAYLKSAGKLPVNVKFIIEGEEEIGGPSLDPFVEQNAKLLASSVALISDTGMPAPDLPALTYALRGLCYMEVEVTGPKRDLHSGSFGGAVYNPIQALSEIIVSLKDAGGHIAIPGFYDRVRPLDDDERKSLAEVPFDDAVFRAEAGIPSTWGEEGYTVMELITARPTLDCNGIWGGYTGEGSKTVLPSKASAKISMRLVPDQDHEEIAKLFRDYVVKVAPPQVQVQVRSLHGGRPAIVERNSHVIQAAATALERAFNRRPVFIREGGTIPVVTTFKQVLGIPTVLMGFGLSDDNLHSPNEKFYLPNFYRGVQSSIHFLDELAKA
jgi:acetylornithine deacetylase/succinyl-diaminopimelate desuccinylase-like protein